MSDQPQELINPPAIKKPRKKREKRINRELVVKMLNDGYTKAHTAEVADCTVDSVYKIEDQLITNIKSNQEIIKEFITNRAALLTLEQKERIELSRKLRESIAVDLASGVMKPSEKGKIVFYLDQGFGIFYDKERLETGKSTQNVQALQLFIVQALEKV